MLLAYLEQIEYRGGVTLNHIDDETFDIIDSNINVTLGMYKELYNEIFILKQNPTTAGVLFSKAIELYFDYHSTNSTLSKIVSENSDKEDMDLLLLLLKSSKEYGLSDIQARKIIERTKKL
jgi:hypothetical protein